MHKDQKVGSAMTGRLQGKTALITAAAAGIGRASAIAFADEGARVIATDVDLAALSALRADRIETGALDVRDDASCAAAAERWPEVNVLMNVAGFVHHGTILDCAPSDWAFSFDLNVTSMYRLIRAMLPGFIARGGASIINVASVVSSI